jgi:hypothetical protein
MDAIIHSVAGGQHQNGRGIAALPQFTADSQSIDDWEHNVEDDHVIRGSFHPVQGISSRKNRVYGISRFLEPAFDIG